MLINKQFHICFNLFIIFLAIYILTLSSYTITDVGIARMGVLTSLFERFDLNISPGSGVEGIVGIDGREYSWFGIGSVLLSFPFYLLAKWFSVSPYFAVSFLSPIIGAATNVLLFLFSQTLGYSKRASLIVAFLYGLSTSACYYAKDTGDHAIETFFLLLSFYFMYLHTIDRKISFILYSAFALGACFITRLNAVIAIPALLLLPLLEYISTYRTKPAIFLLTRKISLFLIGLTPFIALCMWYNYYRFGSVLETGYTLYASRLGVDYFGGANLINGLSGLLFSPGKGFFYYSPPAILILFSLYPFYKQHPRLATSFATLICVYFLFYAKNLFWHGDWAWGPRYLVATLPFFIMPTARLFEKATQRFKYLAYLTLAMGIAVQLLATSVNPAKYFIDLQIHQNTTFNESKGKGAPSIIEPPENIYFDWRKSPIISHFNSFAIFANNINTYKYARPDANATSAESIKSEPWMNTFDFWWVYSYTNQGDYSTFAAVLALMLIAGYCCRNLYNAVFRC